MLYTYIQRRKLYEELVKIPQNKQVCLPFVSQNWQFAKCVFLVKMVMLESERWEVLQIAYFRQNTAQEIKQQYNTIYEVVMHLIDDLALEENTKSDIVVSNSV
ncbi:Hypothetical_protein [Hexamita inflata]|uniref:Hypothetical_protein n=1 Tax=Hexamita inflata TaxID=28002 RepID=A0AA86NPV1_9EUKA|nr:Hypothetical protein HINF_LOCUS11560 [Hexamita inflata]CAI9924362.1 Hypothetical protein HINF_LOCUS12007 [Hexamita inflata]CAI9925540.1 Hypothetical protein HINF_LOCUS13185 [Hexamita inflata]CAI9928545.1 Hypothetical protein HINF_LOCUS16190 [Hexamita inflata]